MWVAIMVMAAGAPLLPVHEREVAFIFHYIRAGKVGKEMESGVEGLARKLKEPPSTAVVK